MLVHPRMPEQHRQALRLNRSAFLLGNTAPDFGTVSGLPRAASHFFDVPMLDRRPAHLRLLARHPELVRPDELAPDRAAFVAGYLAHLWLDQAWIATFFEPIFGPEVPRGSFHQRLVNHNLLRAYLDQKDRNRLQPEVGTALNQAEPNGWLAFAPDKDLRQWRNHLRIQLEPGGSSRTVRVFSSRLGISADKFAARLASRAEMERAVFRYLPQSHLRAFWDLSLIHSVELVAAYLAGEIQEAPTVSRPFRRRPISMST